MQLSDHEFKLLKEYLHRQSGIDVPDEKRYLFTTRLGNLLKSEGCATFMDFYAVLISGMNQPIVDQVLALMTTHESGFNRDAYPFRVFRDVILPEMAQRRVEQAHFMRPRLRILSAGCSFGQEPYSIALCLHQWLPTQSVYSLPDIAIVGIDVSGLTIERARQGVYTNLEIGKHLSPQERLKYFRQIGETWQLCEEIRTMVTFRQVNLLEPFEHLGKFDAVFCRNVIIYFTAEGRKKVLDNLHKVVEPEGVLILGSAESLYNINSDFTSRTVGQTTFYTPSSLLSAHNQLKKGSHA